MLGNILLGASIAQVISVVQFDAGLNSVPNMGKRMEPMVSWQAPLKRIPAPAPWSWDEGFEDYTGFGSIPEIIIPLDIFKRRLDFTPSLNTVPMMGKKRIYEDPGTQRIGGSEA